MDDTELFYDFDELKMYFGEDYWVTDKICIHCPTVGDILEFGDTKFYSMINLLCANPTTLRLQLWRSGYDWNEISDFDLFARIIAPSMTPDNTSLLFDDLNFSWFEYYYNNKAKCNELVYVPHDEYDNPIHVDYEETPVINELIYLKIIKYLCIMFNLNPKVEHAKNKATKEAIIWEDEINEKIQEKKIKDREYSKSFLLPLISAMVNHPGFKYKTNELKEIGIVQFMDSVQRLQVYESTRALLQGSYSGFCDVSKLPKDEFNFMRELK